MKVCIKPVLEYKNRKNNSLHFVQGSFHQGNVLLFQTTAGRHSSCMAMFAIVCSVFKHVNPWDSKDTNGFSTFIKFPNYESAALYI